eukprot:14001148-Alexandrium_andersonii.AAC.1
MLEARLKNSKRGECVAFVAVRLIASLRRRLSRSLLPRRSRPVPQPGLAAARIEGAVPAGPRLVTDDGRRALARLGPRVPIAKRIARIADWRIADCCQRVG